MTEGQGDFWESESLHAFLVGAGLCREGGGIEVEPLKGGVSSDIVLVRCGAETFVVKKALARLKVAREWVVPVSRNASEVNYLREAARLAPGAVPKILAYDPGFGGYAMEFLDPRDYPVWKEELRQGRADPEFAERLGSVMARIHAGTHGRKDMAATFETGALFHALRLEPYLEAATLFHPDLRAALFALSKATLEVRLALVHGDISPKNILCGPNGPVLLDAECAWYGDPAFDLAFCLNHLLLKCLWNPARAEGFLICFEALSAAYLSRVDWETAEAIEARAARLLPALLLARVDGKSPAEYVDDSGKALIRRFASPFILNPIATLAGLRHAWSKETQID